jgi:sortase A
MSPQGSAATGPGRFQSTPLRWLEHLAWTAGILLLGAWALGSLDSVAGRRLEMQRFMAPSAAMRLRTGLPDTSLWDAKRIEAWRETFSQDAPLPLAVLRIPRIGLEVPVLEGIDAWTLNRAVGHIAGTALPGEEGNTGIAGHRDGFFRGLKDVAIGDTLELETLTGSTAYRIEQTWVVDPPEVWVLEPTPTRAITLVTCYPFYFIGPAPHRFIVRAVPAPAAPPVGQVGPKSY